MINTLEKNSIQPVKNVLVRSLSLFQADQKSVECTGYQEGRISMSTLGDHPANANIIANNTMLIIHLDVNLAKHVKASILISHV